MITQARLWALRGTPFIYLWHTPDKPIMRGASIPVFGATRALGDADAAAPRPREPVA